jgi:hypothetical protein
MLKGSTSKKGLSRALEARVGALLEEVRRNGPLEGEAEMRINELIR